VESYGKGGIAGLHGEQEHVVACLTTVFETRFVRLSAVAVAGSRRRRKSHRRERASTFRSAYKDELYVRSHYDAMTLTAADAPRPDELLICVAVASGGRIHERVGGMTVQEVLSAARV
jgi:hypothetical protein